MSESPESASVSRRPGRPQPARMSPYERIKQAILQAELVPGEPLVETVLAEWCQVSRTPVREALTRLEQDGMITRGPRGLIVRDRSPGEILDIYETRIVLESRTAMVAAERRSAFDLLAMRRAADRFREADGSDPVNSAGRNRDLHRTIWTASHNGSLIDLLERLDLQLGWHPATTLTYSGRHEAAVREHDELVDAIEAHDRRRAADVATNHFTSARDIRLKLWASES